jgi:molybdopterin synthase catalytic subunit
MNVTVLFFAHLREATGTERLDVELPDGADVGALAEAVLARWPALRPRLERYPVLVDGYRVDRSHALVEGAEVAWLPPVAGGAPARTASQVVEARLTREPIDVPAMLREVQGREDGAVVLFVGVVRDHEGERSVERLEYEAYWRVAEQQLRAIAEEGVSRWPGARVAIRHRLGPLGVGEASVAVAVATAHRGDAFDCCRHLIERIKKGVPIWKRSYGPEGAMWVEGAEYQQGAED